MRAIEKKTVWVGTFVVGIFSIDWELYHNGNGKIWMPISFNYKSLYQELEP